MSRRFAFFLVGCLTAAIAFPGRVDAGPRDRAELVAEILERGGKRVPGALDAAREAYAKAQDDSPRDLRIDYAFALVLLKQQAYDESLEMLRKLQSQSSGATRVLCGRLQVWVLLQQKNYKEAVQQVETVCGSLLPSAGQAKQDATAIETAEFFGRVFEYLEYAQPKAVGPAELQRVKGRVRQKLSPEASAGFARGFDDAKKTYEGLTEAIRLTKEEAPKIYTAALKDLDDEKAAAEQRSRELQKEVEQLDADLAAKVRPLEVPERQAEARKRLADMQLAAAKAAEDRKKNRSGSGYVPDTAYDSKEVDAAQEQADEAKKQYDAQVRIRTNLEDAAHAQMDSRRRAQQKLARVVVVCDRRRRDMVKAGPDKAVDTYSYYRRLGLLATYVDPPFEAEKKRILASYQK